MLFVDIEKRVGDFTLNVCFESKRGVLSLVGMSGSGKSLTLKCIAGIERPDKGRIILNNRTLFDSEKGIDVPPQKRRVGYLFQQYALFPNMSVKQNIEAALHHLPRKERQNAANEILREFGIEKLQNKMPRVLSGGEQQRCALARIIASNPEALLLDEPFSALDSFLKWQLLVDIKNTIERFGKDVIFVTHNIDEIFGLSDKVCVLSAGKTEEVVSASDAYRCPKTVSAAKLLGCNNFSRIDLSEKGIVGCSDWNVKLKSNSIKISESNVSYAGIYAKDIELRSNSDEEENVVSGIISQIVQVGTEKVAIIKISDTENHIWATFKANQTVNINEKIKVYIDPEKLLLLEE